MTAMTDPVQKNLTFIQYDIPPLKSGEYTITATQTVNQIQPNSFSASKSFAVPGNRFQLNGDDIVSVFPAPLANGEFTGVMPLVMLQRQTLPWQRTSVFSEEDAPWLAILLFEEADAPTVQPATAADLFPTGTTITVAGSTVTGQGTMPSGFVSYPDINPLDYGQTPSDPCSIIDLSAELFSKVCPSATDLPFLAHIRETDTYDTYDSTETVDKKAIVLGNRWPTANADAYAFLVSLENMGDLLPNNDGTQSPNLPAGSTVRLICFRTWRFFANDLDEKFQSLCENLNKNAEGTLGLTTLRLPAATPDPTAFAAAVKDQATGALTPADADVLVQNGLCLGYTALDHHLREAGHTVSWCRGPFVPYPITPYPYTIASCPDAVMRYDPQTGLFDATYAQAWQLGQLLALQSSSFSVALYNWKQTLQKGIAAQEEMALIQQKLGGADILSSFFAPRSLAVADLPDVPKVIADWIGRLKLLKGVPFSALVPDEGMLPVESLRFFHLDLDWIAAIVDGAFSIGRAGTTGAARDAQPLAQTHAASQISARRQRKNHRPNLAAMQASAGDSDFEVVTGVLLRSQLVSGWPGLNVNGYSDAAGTNELPKLRMERLSSDVMLCMFEGAVQMLAIHEAPQQLHCGVEGDATAGFTTTLREVVGDTPGQQYLTDPKGGPATAAVSVRPDGQTIQAAATAQAIETKLNSDFDQKLTQFTSAEFALEMVKGVVKVEFQLQ